MPSGKKGEINIPEEIQNNSYLLLVCIRGIFDTDGCVALQRDRKYTYPFISISTTSKTLSQTVKENLIKIGFKPYICIDQIRIRRKMIRYAIRIKGKEQLRLWNDKIGSKNPRNLVKLETLVN